MEQHLDDGFNQLVEFQTLHLFLGSEAVAVEEAEGEVAVIVDSGHVPYALAELRSERICHKSLKIEEGQGRESFGVVIASSRREIMRFPGVLRKAHCSSLAFSIFIAVTCFHGSFRLGELVSTQAKSFDSKITLLCSDVSHNN